MVHVSSVLAAVMHRFYMRSEQASLDFCDELVDGGGRELYLDSPLSVSGLIEIETDCDYDPTHIELNRRFIHMDVFPDVDVVRPDKDYRPPRPQ